MALVDQLNAFVAQKQNIRDDAEVRFRSPSPRPLCCSRLSARRFLVPPRAPAYLHRRPPLICAPVTLISARRAKKARDEHLRNGGKESDLPPLGSGGGGVGNSEMTKSADGMNQMELMESGRKTMKETDQSLARSAKVVQETLAIGAQVCTRAACLRSTTALEIARDCGGGR